MLSRCQIRRGYVTAKHMCICVSQNTCDSLYWKLSKLSSCEINECLRKRKKRSCPLSSLKPRPKGGKKAFSCESSVDLASSDKGSFFNQDEWLQEIEEHERKPDTSGKQSVEMSVSRSKIRLEEAEEGKEDVGSWAELNGRTIVSGENL